jgi:hypothetical protein
MDGRFFAGRTEEPELLSLGANSNEHSSETSAGGIYQHAKSICNNSDVVSELVSTVLPFELGSFCQGHKWGTYIDSVEAVLMED